MELKYDFNLLYFLCILCFNCTFMELKFSCGLLCLLACSGFNCTFMELKSLTSFSAPNVSDVLIVPLWN